MYPSVNTDTTLDRLLPREKKKQVTEIRNAPPNAGRLRQGGSSRTRNPCSAKAAAFTPMIAYDDDVVITQRHASGVCKLPKLRKKRGSDTLRISLDAKEDSGVVQRPRRRERESCLRRRRVIARIIYRHHRREYPM